MLVLASNSPRRKQLLASGGWDFSVVAAQVDERVQPGELPDAYVLRLAENKARAAAGLLLPPVPPQTLIIAADTTVVDPGGDEKSSPVANSKIPEFQPQILGKPSDDQEAEVMLRRLRGRTHQVLTGLAVLRAGDGRLLKDVCITSVSMRNYSDAEMMAYIASGDPLDKAGAYAIQYAEFSPVENLHGCYANVMGLPVCYLMRMLEAFGVPLDVDIAHSCQTTLDYPCTIFRQVLSSSA